MIRADLIINWDSSPRIITVLAPSTDLLLQDLVDTLRHAEAELVNLAYPSLLDATGKDDIGSGGFTGITVVLRNTQVAFEARASGTAICNISGGNLIAKTYAGIIMDEISFTENVNIRSQKSTSPTLVYATGGGSVGGGDFGTIG